MMRIRIWRGFQCSLERSTQTQNNLKFYSPTERRSSAIYGFIKDTQAHGLSSRKPGPINSSKLEARARLFLGLSWPLGRQPSSGLVVSGPVLQALAEKKQSRNHQNDKYREKNALHNDSSIMQNGSESTACCSTR